MRAPLLAVLSQTQFCARSLILVSEQLNTSAKLEYIYVSRNVPSGDRGSMGRARCCVALLCGTQPTLLERYLSKRAVIG